MVSVFVSVIIPVYNRRDCCKNALKVLRAQTLKNIEFIMVDDGSTDGTYDYLIQQTKSDQRFKIYKLNENSGPSVARNFGIHHSQGQYVGFFDIDDDIPRNYFANLYKTANREEVDIVFATYNDMPHKSVGAFSELPEKIAVLRNGSVWDKLFRRDFVVKNNLCFPEKLYCADNVFSFSAFYYATDIYVCNTPSYRYTLSSDSISTDTRKVEKRKADILNVAQQIVDFARANTFDDSALAETYHFLKRTFNSYVLDDAFNKKFTAIVSTIQPANLASDPEVQFKNDSNMFWFKIKKTLGLISLNEYDEMNLLNTIKASGLFDESWYVEHYPDVVANGYSPVKYYLARGWRNGHNPSPYFDNNAYLADNPDVAAADICPLLHYINNGHNEGRYVRTLSVEQHVPPKIIDPAKVYKTLKQSKLFDTKWYLKTYPDVRAFGGDPIEHYMLYGCHEGRNPSPDFDTNYYITQYPDVRASGMNPLFHYIKYGCHEGRTPLKNETEQE